MTNLLEVSGLRVRYNKHIALSDVSVSVQQGTVAAVVGPNGAGKTTLLRSAFGDVPKDGGSVRTAGYDPYDRGDRRKLWSVARSVPDTPALYQELTVHEQLLFAARIYGVPKNMVDEATSDVATNLGLVESLDRRIGELSFGTVRKVHLATGFFSGEHGPQLLVFDEPTVGLDPPSRQLFAQFVRAYVRAGGMGSERSILISSHNLSELSAVADSLIVLRDGAVVAQGAIHDLVNQVPRESTYKIVLNNDEADRLVDAIESEFDFDAERIDARNITVTLADQAAKDGVLRLIIDAETPYRLRSFSEELTQLEQAFIDSLQSDEL